MGFVGNRNTDRPFRGHQCVPDVEIRLALLLSFGLRSLNRPGRNDSAQSPGNEGLLTHAARLLTKSRHPFNRIHRPGKNPTRMVAGGHLLGYVYGYEDEEASSGQQGQVAKDSQARGGARDESRQDGQ